MDRNPGESIDAFNERVRTSVESDPGWAETRARIESRGLGWSDMPAPGAPTPYVPTAPPDSTSTPDEQLPPWLEAIKQKSLAEMATEGTHPEELDQASLEFAAEQNRRDAEVLQHDWGPQFQEKFSRVQAVAKKLESSPEGAFWQNLAFEYIQKHGQLEALKLLDQAIEKGLIK